MKPARYHPDHDLSVFTPCLAKERSDGTFDLFYNEKSPEPFCTSCPGSDEPKLGHVVLDPKKEPKEKEPKEKEPKEKEPKK